MADSTPASRKRPSQQDVANRAGVSRTTVSFVINGTPGANIPEATRERVWAAVRELGFRPNAMAQGLRGHQSNVLGFITDDIAVTPYAVEITKGAQDAALEQGKTLLIIDTDGELEAEKRATDLLVGWQVDGVIFATEHHRQVDPPKELDGVPCALVDCYDQDRRLASVVPDEVQGGKLATETLLHAGHRRIGFINGPEAFPASAGRLEGYRTALEAAGVAFDPALLRVGDWWQASAYDRTRELMSLPEPPTALFCANDWMAMGAYDALRDLGCEIPGDVAVVGFDDRKEIAAGLRPPLTTVALPYYEMGRWAVRFLLSEEASSVEADPPQVALPCPLVRRESV